MNEREAGRLLAALLLTVALGAALSSGAAGRQSAGEFAVSVAVTGKGGAPVGGLPREAFSVTSGKVLFEITSFEGGGPASAAVLFDLSSSVARARESRLKPATEAAWRLMQSGHESNEYSVVAFADDVFTLLAGSRDREAARKALATIDGALPGRQSAIFDACWQTLRALSTTPHAKRALILLTDGDDTYSRADREDVVRQLKEVNVVVYAVYLGAKPETTEMGAPTGVRLLNTLAEVSGGLACFPKDLKELDACFARIGEDLRARYVITFKPPAPPLEPGKCGTAKVSVAPPAGPADKSFKVRAREEFCAPRPRPQK